MIPVNYGLALKRVGFMLNWPKRPRWWMLECATCACNWGFSKSLQP